MRPGERCPAVHPDDPSACIGHRAAVQIVDATGCAVLGCVHHAAVMLASIKHARAYPGAVPGAAVEAYRLAQYRLPFDFPPPTDAPARTAPDPPAGVTSVVVGKEARVEVWPEPGSSLVWLTLRSCGGAATVALPPEQAATVGRALTGPARRGRRSE